MKCGGDTMEFDGQVAKDRSPPAPTAPPAVVDVAPLFRRDREVRLRLGQEEYRLRLTRNGKLILTK
jgi:hemin uptake protein HemP